MAIVLSLCITPTDCLNDKNKKKALCVCKDMYNRMHICNRWRKETLDIARIKWYDFKFIHIIFVYLIATAYIDFKTMWILAFA